MNNNDSSSLIDESEIRAALSFLHIDRDAFGQSVRQRVKQADLRPVNQDNASLKDRQDLLRIAASVLPINLLGASTTASPNSLAALGVFQKAIAFLALPAISFLMVGVTLVSWFQIRSAQQSQSVLKVDMAQMQDSLYRWWRRYGWLSAIVFFLPLTAPLKGWTTPLLFLFMASAIGTASIITTLGRAGLVDRNVIGGYCIGMLGVLGSMSNTFAISNSTQLLDPHLVTVPFLAGAAFLLFVVNPLALPSRIEAKQKENMQENKRNNFLVLAGFVCLLVLIVLYFIVSKHLSILFAIIALSLVTLLIYWGSKLWPVSRIVVHGLAFVLMVGGVLYFGQTLWRPIRTSTLVQHAKMFEPELVGEWSHWQATARWLQEQGICYDQSEVQTQWKNAFDKEDSNRSYLLNHVVSTGIAVPSELMESKEFRATTKQLLSPTSAGTQIFFIGQYEYIIALLAEEGALSKVQRDHLAGRLLATWRSLDDDRIQESLVTATTITNLLSLIDCPVAEAERKADVARWLVEYQCKSTRPFSPSGGFKRYSTSNNSDLLATEHAIRLMQHYHTHDGVDVLALRAFLRPESSDRQLMLTASVRAIARQRLDQIPGISHPSLWDFLRLNQSLWFATLLVGLCIYATLGSPRILIEADVQEQSVHDRHNT